MMNKLYDKVITNKTVSLLYKIKTYFDIGTFNISWFTGKLPEVMSMIYLLEKVNLILVPSEIVIFSVGLFVFIAVLGLFLRKAGFYVRERQISAKIDPVTNEIYEAAKVINAKFGGKK